MAFHRVKISYILLQVILKIVSSFWLRGEHRIYMVKVFCTVIVVFVVVLVVGIEVRNYEARVLRRRLAYNGTYICYAL